MISERLGYEPSFRLGEIYRGQLYGPPPSTSFSQGRATLIRYSAMYIDQSSGGGAFIVTPLSQTGKLPDAYPLCRAHTAPVLDCAWATFDASLIASAGEDGRVAITRIDERILSDAWSGDSNEVQDLEPLFKFNAHQRKAGHVLWHPTADGILASASTEVRIWDVAAQSAVYTSETHPDMVQSLSWDSVGSVYATYARIISTGRLLLTSLINSK